MSRYIRALWMRKTERIKMASALNRALLKEQYSQIWDIDDEFAIDDNNEPRLSKVWRLTHEFDTGMMAASHFMFEQGGVELDKKLRIKLHAELIMSGYRYAVVEGCELSESDDNKAEQRLYWYIFDTNHTGRLKTDLLHMANTYHQSMIAFQAHDGDYELISSDGGTTQAYPRAMFGVLNGHFYKQVQGRPFTLTKLVGDKLQAHFSVGEARSMSHFAKMSMAEYLQP